MHKFLPVLLGVLFGMSVSAQTVPGGNRHKVAVFAPLYLDSAYTADAQYKHGNSFPRYIIPGLEFYQGVQLALDSMQMEGIPLEVFVYDTKSKTKSLSSILADLPPVELIIGAVGADELPLIANKGLQQKIPVISCSYPNDAGITENPYLVILNSTLSTHIRDLYKVLQKNHALHNLVYFQRKSQQDGWLKNMFTNMATTATGTPLKIEFVELGAGFGFDEVFAKLDSNAHNICIAGSMDEAFNRQLAATLAPYSKSYGIKLYGMPTWDGYRDLNKPEYKDLEISYTSPLYSPRTDKVSNAITDLYRRKFYSRPSDMVFWGYGATWRFCHLLLEYGPDIASNLSVDRFELFTDLDIQPVLNPQSQTLDYFENQKVFLITKQNGVIISAK